MRILSVGGLCVCLAQTGTYLYLSAPPAWVNSPGHSKEETRDHHFQTLPLRLCQCQHVKKIWLSEENIGLPSHYGLSFPQTRGLSTRNDEILISDNSTSGYGHIYPITATGKAACILYAVIGIPFTLIFLSALVQRLLAPTFKLLSSFIKMLPNMDTLQVAPLTICRL